MCRGLNRKVVAVSFLVMNEVSREAHNAEENNFFAKMCGGSEEVSHLGLIDFCITQL